MDDLISRQAAIDAFFNATSDGDKAEFCVAVVKNIPSAQQWIPCSERMPERNGYYLVTGRQGAVNKRLYQDGYWYGNWAIIAWMPLPEPYREEAQP